jgi:uncharacterized membrane protein YfcA
MGLAHKRPRGGERFKMSIAIALVALASFTAGFINALAGGGSFLTLPALIAAGVPPIAANASSTVALFPGQVTTGVSARDGIRAAAKDHRINVPALSAISLVGGLIGGLLLLVTPASLFARIIPWLILFATLVFAFGNALHPESARFRLNRTGVLITQGLIAVYGGYFGGGIGILMLAGLTLYGLRDIWLMNSLKILLAVLMNAAAVVTFIIAGLVHWKLTILAAVAAIIGGYVGIHAARRLPQGVVKGFVIAIGLVLTVYFFVKSA